MPDTSDEPRYTQGIMGDGAAILDDGALLTVEQILDRLNASAMAPFAPADLVALVDAYGNAAYWSHQMEDDSGIGVARNALLAAIGRMGGAAVPLADAMWQLLDDMGADGLSVCPAAKAAARLAYEPFADADVPLEYTAAAARAVALSSTATEPSSGALPEATAADGLMGRLGRLPIVDLGIAWPDRSPPKDPSTHTEPSPDALREARYCLEQLRRIQGWEDPSDADEEQSNWSVYQRTIEALESFEQASAMVPFAPADLVALVDAYGNAAYWSHQMEDDSGIGVARNALLAAIGRMGRGTAPEGWRPIKSVACEEAVLLGWGQYREMDGEQPAFMRWYDGVHPGWYGEPVWPTGAAILQEALEPFARYASHQAFAVIYKNAPDDAVLWSMSGDPGEDGGRAQITVGDLRHAALASAQPRPEVAGEREARLERCLGFFASVIKSGEPWTETCQREYDAARTPVPSSEGSA